MEMIYEIVKRCSITRRRTKMEQNRQPIFIKSAMNQVIGPYWYFERHGVSEKEGKTIDKDT